MEVEVVFSKLTEQIRAELGWHFPHLHSFLLSLGYAASVQLSSSGWVPFMVLHRGDEASEEDAGVWKRCFTVTSPHAWLAVQMTLVGVSHCLVEPACLSVSQLEVVFFTSLEILEWRGAFLQICIEQDSSFLTLRFSCDVSLYWCIFKMHH